MDLQGVVSNLAGRLGKPVALNDFDLSLLAASAHDVEVDEYRVTSILSRRTPAPIVAMLQERGYLERTDPFVLNADLLPGLRPRMCIPIQVQRRNVAFLWIVLGPDAQLTSQEYLQARAAAEQITQMLASQAPDPELDAVVEGTRRLQRLIHSDASTAGYAVAELAGHREIDDQSALSVTVLALEPVKDLERDSAQKRREKPPGVRMDLGALSAPMLALLAGSDVLGIIDGTLVAVSATASPEQLAERMERSLERSQNPVQFRVRGSGSSVTKHWRSGLREAYLEAVYAARLAGVVPEAPRHCRYGDLGALILFRGLTWSASSVTQISPEASALVTHCGEVNRQTLLTYLRLGGDIQRTCSQLNIHRTTLYYRLERCRIHIGGALEDGWRRSSLYLGLVLAELVEHTERAEQHLA